MRNLSPVALHADAKEPILNKLVEELSTIAAKGLKDQH